MDDRKNTITSTIGCMQVKCILNELRKSHEFKFKFLCFIFRSKAEIHSKRADLAKEKLIEMMRCYEQKLQSQSIDIQRLQEAYGRLKSEQNTCKTMHQQPELVIESLKECQR